MLKLFSTLQVFLLLHFSTPIVAIPGLDVLFSDDLKNITLHIYGPNDKSPTTRSTDDDFENVPVDANFPIKVILHGWKGSNHKDFIEATVDAFQRNQYQKYNIISVDYANARTINYYMAAKAADAVGKRLGAAIWKIVTNYEFTWGQVHIIGLSLGAQVAGSVGRYIQHLGQKVDRITGLDPARPFFEYPAQFPALSSSDADFVDVIHTNGKILGMYESIGHVDFYPNGGSLQPGCPVLRGVTSIFGFIDSLISSLKIELPHIILCDHERSIWYFIESINSDGFVSRKCSNHYSYLMGWCGNNEINIMGLNTNRDTSGDFHLLTNGTSPYAKG